MRLFDVCTKKVFERDGEKKEKWYKAGIMKITDRGHHYLRLFHQPQNDFYLFEREPKEDVIQLENET